MNAAAFEIPRFSTAIAEWISCTVYILMLRHRFHGRKLYISVAAAFLFQAVFLSATGELPLGFWVPCMMSAVAFMFLYILLCCDISVKDAAYYGVNAFVLAEFSASLAWQIYWYFWQDDSFHFVLKHFMTVVIYAAAACVIWILERHHISSARSLNVTKRELWSAVIIGAVVFALSNVSFLPLDTPFSGRQALDVLNIRTLVDIGGLAILYAHLVMCSQTRSRRELAAILNVMKNQYAQYKQSRESIEIINRKYHDLKHQINALRVEQDPEKRTAWLDEMESDIIAYEAEKNTGNAVLDTIIMSKSLYCQKHGISLTCVADGTLLQFMDVMDICTVFGNALDNAIESESKILNKDKRLIHLTVSRERDFLLLRFENYYEGQLLFEDGLPVTTKKDTDFHGFGLKNVKYTVQKYGGSVTVSAENNWFCLTALIPIPE